MTSLRGLCRQLIVVPYGSAIVNGDKIDLETLQKGTRQAYMEIAAAIVEGYQ